MVLPDLSITFHCDPGIQTIPDASSLSFHWGEARQIHDGDQLRYVSAIVDLKHEWHDCRAHGAIGSLN
jgi:hypothetical protein